VRHSDHQRVLGVDACKRTRFSEQVKLSVHG
jgi:hypothetical protein